MYRSATLLALVVVLVAVLVLALVAVVTGGCDGDGDGDGRWLDPPPDERSRGGGRETAAYSEKASRGIFQ